jgi:hypothetical protein
LIRASPFHRVRCRFSGLIRKKAGLIHIKSPLHRRKIKRPNRPKCGHDPRPERIVVCRTRKNPCFSSKFGIRQSWRTLTNEKNPCFWPWGYDISPTRVEKMPKASSTLRSGFFPDGYRLRFYHQSWGCYRFVMRGEIHHDHLSVGDTFPGRGSRPPKYVLFAKNQVLCFTIFAYSPPFSGFGIKWRPKNALIGSFRQRLERPGVS